MIIREIVKKFAPRWFLRARRDSWARRHQRAALQAMPREARELYLRARLTSYEHVVLDARDEECRQSVERAARELYGDGWNFYSDALRVEIVQGFAATIDSLVPRYERINYLEIGSCQGLSMALVASLLRLRGTLGSLVSVDPYFEDGFVEGAFGPQQKASRIAVNKRTRDKALDLYGQLGLDVTLIEAVSLRGLSHLLSMQRVFQLIYIDGSHEGINPVTDFGLSVAMLDRDGTIVLDDHLWPDVKPLKELCDKHATKVHETWKTVAYSFPQFGVPKGVGRD